MLVEHKDVRGNIRDEVDFVVVGAGACGPVTAKELAEAGFSVALVEEGAWWRPEQLHREPSLTMRRMFREAGMRTTIGNVFMPNMQAKCMGGTSFVNSAICFRLPDFVMREWQNGYGVRIEKSELEQSFDRVEKTAQICPTAMEIQGRRNLLIKEGLEKLGVHSAPNPRNVVGCDGSCDCFSGCPIGAKKSTEISYIPPLMEAGGKVFASCRAEKILTDNGRAAGIMGTFLEPGTDEPGYTLTLKAKRAVVLSAGVIADPVILQKNRLANSSGKVGKYLSFHPGAGMAGLFDEEVNPWYGAYQGWHSKHLLEKHGIKVETLWAPPAVLTVRIPGFGQEHKDLLAKMKYMSTIDMTYRAVKSMGFVKAQKGWDPLIYYRILQEDIDEMKVGLKFCADILFAAGAKSILPGVFGLPSVFDDPKQTDLLLTTKIKAQHLTIVANHVFGTCRMGEDPKTSVVNSDMECHDVRDLYVCDTAVFPTPSGVNPMETGMALADLCARRMIKKYS